MFMKKMLNKIRIWQVSKSVDFMLWVFPIHTRLGFIAVIMKLYHPYCNNNFKKYETKIKKQEAVATKR